MLKTLTMASISTAALLAAQGAHAQTEDSGDNRRERDQIVVTATKVETNLQETPIAITAVTSETLAERGLTTTADLGKIVPNADFQKSQGVFGPAVTVFLRGIGQSDPQLNGEPAVAFYIDDVYYPHLFGSQFDLLDLDHVEVLRGPQGTLFGRNAIAGALNIVSKKPSLTEASASIEATMGAYERRDFRAAFSVPVTDNLAVAVTALSKKREGYQEMIDFSCQMYMNGTPELAGSFPFQTPDTTFGGGRTPDNCVIDHLGGEDTRAIRGSVYWEPTDRLSVSFSADYMDQNDEIPAEYISDTDYAQTTTRPNFVTAFDEFSVPGETPFQWDNRFETGDPYKTYDNYCDPFPAGTLIPGNTYYNGSVFKGGKCYGNTVPLTNWGFQGKAVYGITDNIDFTLIGGYRELELSFGAASDGTPLNDSVIYHAFDESHWNGEARLTGQHDWIDWVAGFFYYKGSAEHIGQPQGVRAGTQRFQVDLYEPTAWAGYGNVVIHLLDDRLNLTGGIRRSDDEKFVDFNSLTDATPPGQLDFVASPASTIFDVTIATERWDWKAGIDYRFTDELMLYASAGTGYRLPGFNVRPSQPGQEGQTPGEALRSYEIGAKSELFDGRLKTNLAAFLMDFTERPATYAGQEAQLTDDLSGNVPGASTVIPGGPTGTGLDAAFFTCRDYDMALDGPANPAAGVGVNCVARSYYYSVAGKVKGIEAEIEAEPVDNLHITGSMGYVKWKADDITRVVRVPDWTASAGVSYEFLDVLGGSITPRLDWYFTGRTAYNANLPEFDQEAYSLVNTRITYHNEEHDYDVSIGATNLFEKFYYRNKIAFQAFGLPTNLGQPAAPREWYVTVKKRF
ncbi:TonB-dependent receptor [Marinicaulis aureus]|uniref:TonB-dependent receptor n=1 Tax=Hyphococcus aureus TaxID=2666033 RepID=A0ABW1KTI9_9PROT